jgi:hypothetical protein
MEVGFHLFPTGKKYTYVKKDNALIFLRNIIFLTKPHNLHRIVVVREWGANSNKHVWEPPKGQMEWKEFAGKKIRPGDTIPGAELLSEMKKGVQREMVEEAKILPKDLHSLKSLDLRYIQAWPESGVPNAFFMYQFWHATINNTAIFDAQNDMEELTQNIDLNHALPKDLVEKDAVTWWTPSNGWDRIRTGFSKKMTLLYFKYLQKHGL